ncbi:MAG: Appr-1-p processing protein, partial [Bacteroidota bacterium]
VGKAMVLETGSLDIPFLISAPTMRVPMSFNIFSSINAYLAMKAALLEAKKHDKIEVLAIPGFCTGCGKMDYTIAAREMFIAFQEIELGQKVRFHDFREAQDYHLAINPKGNIWDK